MVKPSAEFKNVVRGGLKLKGGEAVISKKKKRKEREVVEAGLEANKDGKDGKESKEDRKLPQVPVLRDTRTAAEKQRDSVHEAMEAKLIAKSIEKTHRQKIDQFNFALSQETEHFDIPRISWTK